MKRSTVSILFFLYKCLFIKCSDTTYRLLFLANQKMVINLQREDTFATYAGIVMDENEEPLCGVMIRIGNNIKCLTDKEGKFHTNVPLKEQTFSKKSLSKKGYIDLERDDETPSHEIMYI